MFLRASLRDARFHPDKPEDYRSPAQRDRDRILYTSAFQRLAEVTQVVSADEGHVFHNRLTHSIKVAQVARRLAEKLSSPAIDPDVAESAALAHDLGHPPFGHVAEKTLDKLVVGEGIADGFEGNAQSFRIVTKLASRSDHPGLNLTRATLNAILKYPWLRAARGRKHRKWGVYKTERKEFNWTRKPLGRSEKGRALEAELMDWADDVTYAVHDVTDFFRAGLIPVDRLATSLPEREKFFVRVEERYKDSGSVPDYSRKKLEAVFDVIESFPFNESYKGTWEHRARLRNHTDALIARYVGAVQLRARGGNLKVAVDDTYRREVALLKELTWVYVILNPALATQQYGHVKIITALFNTYFEAAKQRKYSMFPLAFQEIIRNTRRNLPRVIADLIASMTEQQAIRMYRRLTGTSLGSIADALVR